MDLFERELHVALDAAKQAGDLIRKDYASFVAIPNAPASISTETDRGAQEMILKHLQTAFPDDALCAEEATQTLAQAKRSGSRIWIVDPIDGTRGFAMKNGEFSVMIGLMVDGELAVGVVLEPVVERTVAASRGEFDSTQTVSRRLLFVQRTTFASRGNGCWVAIGKSNPSPCRVSQRTKLHESALVQSHSKSSKDISGPVKMLKPGRILEMYSAGVKLALVARGEAELYVNTYPNFHDWDICAGHLLVTEAGGKVTTLQGQPIGYCQPRWEQRGGLLATNGHIHDEAVRLLGVGEPGA